jgi:hypothetical protein
MDSFDLPWSGETELPNPGVVVPVGGGAIAGWFIADYALGIPGFGMVAGAIVGLPFIYRVENGGAESEPAPYHFTQAEASLAAESEQYADAKVIDQYRDVAWSERMKTPLDALEVSDSFDDNAARRLSAKMIGDEWLKDVQSAAKPEMGDGADVEVDDDD